MFFSKLFGLNYKKKYVFFLYALYITLQNKDLQ